ncbi:mitochondrial proton/calcium exchanger protein [Musca vetustissima]|uniref:mitochondrial proton/calcium exchanger protein n=1 Tax=Musca vetustissima TaxID=27455 RepID=UPI002AB7847A|nr:mitochondrial proton/calcium exchanger protein [Musca vetustissima]
MTRSLAAKERNFMDAVHTNAHNRSHFALKYRIEPYSGAAATAAATGGSLQHGISRSALLPGHYYLPLAAGSFYDTTTTILNSSSYRSLHISHRRYEQPSSKVEVTVQTMKNKQKEKVEEILKEVANGNAAAAATPNAVTAAASVVTETSTANKLAESPPKQLAVKKSLKTRIWEEIVHYYHGFRLLFIDINICRKLLWRVLNGKTLTRRENKLLVRTTSDLFRLIPFSVFIIVPFMELLLPVFIKFFPGMLPSTFQTTKEREDKLKQNLQVRLEMAKFLQKTLDEMAVQHKEHKSEEAKQFDNFFQKIKNPTEYVSNEEIIKYAKRFEDEITLDSLTREQLAALCKVLELNTVGTTNFLRFQLRMKLRSLAADDRVIAREGVNSLDLWELQQACKARGMRAYGLTQEKMRTQLQEWIDLSLNEKVPPTLLLLSRTMLISDDSMTTDKLKETIRVLPDSLAAQTKAAIGEREGKIDNKTKIQIIKEEERKIKEEMEEEKEEEKAKAADKVLVDAAAAAADKAATIDVTKEASMENTLTSKDVELLSEALKSLSSDKKMVVEKETIKDLKEELEEYKEDVEELREVRQVVKEPVRESRAAKMLFKKVNSMIGQLDKVLDDLEKKQKEKALPGADVSAEELRKAELEAKSLEEDIVQIEDLVQTIKKLKQTSDESRLKQIENVLSKLDADKDGAISVDEVLKVIEAIGRENVKLDEKQLEELISLLDKEQVIETQDKIEKALAKSIKEADNVKKLAEEIADAAAAAAAAAKNNPLTEDLRDCAKVVKENALDLDALDGKNVLKAKEGSSDAALLEAAEKQKEKILPKTDISSTMPPSIPPTTTTSKTTPTNSTKDKMI